MKKTAYINGIILDGTKDMVPVSGKVMIVTDGIITDIIDQTKYHKSSETDEVDLKRSYITPGLINLHVHLPGNGGASKKPRDNKKLVGTLMRFRLSRSIVKRMCADYAAIEFYSGVTTIRCVGGIADFDSQIRNEIKSGKRVGPRMLVADTAITVDGGHMEGSVAKAVHSPQEAVAMVETLAKNQPDLIKLMVTGGVMDGTVKGEPGQLKMDPAIIKAACDKAHELGFPVAAHVEGLEGLKAALKGGVDTIEHGAKPDAETIQLFRENNASVITTISPAVPYATFDPKDSYATAMGNYNGKIVLDGIVSCSREALENNIPVGLGNDVGCPFITQYNFWRELQFFADYCNITPSFALHTATLVNAQIAGISDITGSIEIGKSADFIVMKENPLDDLRELSNITGVCLEGKYVDQPLTKIKKKDKIDRLFDQ